MDDDRARAFGKRLAEKSPRLHGLFTAGVGLAALLVLALVRSALGVRYPIAQALMGAAVLAGLWFLVTGRSYMDQTTNVPPWWRAGAMLAVIVGAMAGFFWR